MNVFQKVAYKIFRKYLKAHKEDYNQLRLEIKQARIGVPWDIYVSDAYLSSIISVVFLILIGFLLIPLWRFLYINYLKIAPYTGNKIVSNYGEILFILFIILFVSLILGVIA
ncbi:MAG: hypothetical protein Q7J35_01665, partial [Candidatus Methanoperedens sp.]|nr:hypothetical protein [Candidatus Methanoperedens sp.]